MADYLPYQHPTPRDANPDKIVRLIPERWQSLVEFIRVNYADLREGDEITVHLPTYVGVILYLPAVYQAA